MLPISNSGAEPLSIFNQQESDHRRPVSFSQSVGEVLAFVNRLVSSAREALAKPLADQFFSTREALSNYLSHQATMREEERKFEESIIDWFKDYRRDSGAELEICVKGVNLTIDDRRLKLREITELSLSRHHITSLPTSFGGLTSLTHLYIQGDRLASLPEEIGLLQSLKMLDLSHPLTSLPTSLSGFTSLTALYLSSNQLPSLPEEIGFLPLKNLLANSPLTSLPTSFWGLTSLENLFLYTTHLTDLPVKLGALNRLRSLCVCKNQLISLPTSLGSLTSLTYLNLAKNQLRWRYNRKLCLGK